eukprot:15142214-Alexandrium_andersonii.AAC.1
MHAGRAPRSRSPVHLWSGFSQGVRGEWAKLRHAPATSGICSAWSRMKHTAWNRSMHLAARLLSSGS